MEEVSSTTFKFVRHQRCPRQGGSKRHQIRVPFGPYGPCTTSPAVDNVLLRAFWLCVFWKGMTRLMHFPQRSARHPPPFSCTTKKLKSRYRAGHLHPKFLTKAGHPWGHHGNMSNAEVRQRVRSSTSFCKVHCSLRDIHNVPNRSGVKGGAIHVEW